MGPYLKVLVLRITFHGHLCKATNKGRNNCFAMPGAATRCYIMIQNMQLKKMKKKILEQKVPPRSPHTKRVLLQYYTGRALQKILETYL